MDHQATRHYITRHLWREECCALVEYYCGRLLTFIEFSRSEVIQALQGHVVQGMSHCTSGHLELLGQDQLGRMVSTLLFIIWSSSLLKLKWFSNVCITCDFISAPVNIINWFIVFCRQFIDEKIIGLYHTTNSTPRASKLTLKFWP